MASVTGHSCNFKKEPIRRSQRILCLRFVTFTLDFLI